MSRLVVLPTSDPLDALALFEVAGPNVEVEDARELGEETHALCPDAIDQGDGFEALVARLRESGDFTLWWDRAAAIGPLRDACGRVRRARFLSMRALFTGFLLLAFVLPALGVAAQPEASEESPSSYVAGDDGVLMLLSLSGGGLRAAAFGYGVVLALDEMRDDSGSMLERLDRVGGVSGGSFVAAQVALDTSETALGAFRQKVLLENIEAKILKTAASMGLDLARADTNRSDAAAAFYDTLYGGARWADLEGTPELWIQATDMPSGRPFSFQVSNLAHIGFASGELGLGTAIAASAAVPGVFPPLRLGVESHRRDGCPGADVCGAGRGEAALVLADGGISDNLALESLFSGGELPVGTRGVVVIVVNSRRALPLPWRLDQSALVSAGYTVALQQRRLDQVALALARERLRALAAEAAAAGRSLTTELIEIDFEQSAERAELGAIGTRLDLDADEVDLLIAEGRRVMHARAEALEAVFRP